MDFNNFPGFDALKEAFNKFAAKHNGDDLKMRGIRSLAAGGKAALDKAQTEFPKAFVNNLATDIYALIASQEVADGVSAAVRSFDEEKVKDSLDALVDKLKDQETSEKIATEIKKLLQQAPIDELEANIEAMLGDRSAMEKMMFQAFFMQIKPQLEEIRDGSVEEGAERIRELADMIPTEAVAQQVGNLTRNVTPEFVSKQTHDLVGKLPSPNAVSDILHGVAKQAAEKLEQVSTAKNIDDVKAIVSNLGSDLQQTVSDAIEADKQSKKSFGRKKGGSDLAL